MFGKNMKIDLDDVTAKIAVACVCFVQITTTVLKTAKATKV